MHLTLIVGARPNFVKAAALLAPARRCGDVAVRLIHTGQHYDERLSGELFADLGLPTPDVHLGVGPAPPAGQLGAMLLALDPVLAAERTDAVVVVGDVTSTLAGALAAARSGIPVAHVEAGLRSGDRSMPEELNRILTDHAADFLFTSEPAANENLRAEGIPPHRTWFVGNVMIDTFLRHREVARRRPTLARWGVSAGGYALCTIHRPANVDTPDAAERTVRLVTGLAARLPTLFPIHPRTAARLEAFGGFPRLTAVASLQVLPPLGYLDFLALLDGARLVVTDSGGIQEETTALGIPCLTYRENTERPITVTHGTNRVVGNDPEVALRRVEEVLAAPPAPLPPPPLWDGRAGERVILALREQLRA